MEKLEQFGKFICCINDPVFPDPYNFQFGRPEDLVANKELFEGNFVKTSVYTWYDFLPKALILQFYRLANIFFLFIAILQSIPSISPLGPLTAWGPLIVVLGISMIRQGYQDYQRYKSDKKLNHEYKTHILRQGQFIQVQWQEVLIGDICRVKQKDLFPADLILLSSQHDDGVAYIQTANLDGEKNLKPRNSYPQTQKFNNEQTIRQFEGQWQGILPDKNTQNFQSTLTFGNVRINYQKQKQLLWRETRLMNTKWIYGLVIYTGRNTKIMKNSELSASKMSQIEKKVNYILGFILLAQLVLSFIGGLLAGLFNLNNSATNTYIDWVYSASATGILTFFSYFVLVNTMIPISLIVSIEIVKMAQSYFINKDQFMYSELRKTGALVKSASLNEELGQIEHIFSDKTGTLTTNRMQFKIACIGNFLYGDLGLIAQDQQIPVQETKGFHDDTLRGLLLAPDSKHNTIQDIFVRDREKKTHICFNNKKAISHQYLIALSIAHEVAVQQDQSGKLVYQGPSPDEITLVQAARDMGFQFIKSTQSTTAIKLHGQAKQFELLQSFPFNSDRKRMSVIVRADGMIKMYIKGADSIVKNRLARDQTFELDDELTKFSNIGLRTLLIAMRIISEAEYNEFKKKTNHLPIQNREKLYNNLVSQLQSELYLIGATAVLDRLQDEVPETIRDMIRANIKVWMLTGDKMETAENIAKSCNLIQPTFKVLKCNFPQRTLQGVNASLIQMRKQAQQYYRQATRMTLMVEGTDLAQITTEDAFQDHFIAIAQKCQSVVCCRLLPLQKAEVVKIVRKKLDKITLAIGDGANDTPMIKAAHIGIGLYGQQGAAAVQASDYALPQFRMLWRLLLVHGRWNYMRIAEMILYFFYKNMLFTLPQFLFAFYNGYSGQSIYDDMYVSLYNLVFTSIPLIVRALFEQDVYYLNKLKSRDSLPADYSATNFRQTNLRLSTAYSRYIPKGYFVNKYIYRLFPKLYYIGQENCIFNNKNFFFWVFEGVLEAILIFFFTIYILDTTSMKTSGLNPDMWIVSLTIYSSIVLVVTFKIATHTKFLSFVMIASLLVLAVGVYVCYMWISQYYFSPNIVGTTYQFYTTAQTYFIVLYASCIVLFFDGIVLSFDFDNSGILKKLRNLIDDEKQFHGSEYEKYSIKISVATAAGLA